MIYDVLIIGSGPAGYTAAIYAKRAGLSVAIIQGLQPGGQLTLTYDVENYPGFVSVQGNDLMQYMYDQTKRLEVEIVEGYVKKIHRNDDATYRIITSNHEYHSKTVILSTGASAKWLHVKGEEEYKGYGVSGCATCDGFFFQGAEVAVVGGGDTALEEAIYLSAIAKKVYLIHRRDQLRGEEILQNKFFQLSNTEIIWNHVVDEVIGTNESVKSMTGLRLKNTVNNEITTLAVEALFVAIGHHPNTDFLKDSNMHIAFDNEGYVLTDTVNTTHVLNHNSQIISGLYASGDVADKIYRQAVVAAGTGCMAALDAKNYLNFNT